MKKITDKKLNKLALGYAAAIISAAGMFSIGILASLGLYTGAAQQMMQMHMFFSLNVLGMITGIIEAAILAFMGGYVFAWLYNKFI